MTMRHLLAATLCLNLWTAATPAADWPCYLGANRDNTSADKNLKLWSGDTAKVLWKKNVGTGHSCLAVVGKQLYTQGNGGVSCLNVETGDLVWRWPAEGQGKGGETTATPAVADGNLFVMLDGGTLLVAEAAPAAYNELARAKVLEGQCWTVPVVANRHVYCRSHAGDLRCVDLR